MTQVFTFCLQLLTFSQEESQVIRDERKDHDAVDESSLKHQIHESANYTLIVRETGALGLVLPGLMAGRQAGKRNHLCAQNF